MRRALGALVVLALIAITPMTLALAVSEWGNYKDKFETGGYSGSYGTIFWGPDWTEVGESNGPGSGKVRVVGSGCSGQCLRIETGLLGLAGGGAYRLADTGDFANGELSYQAAFDGGSLLGLVNATLSVQATSNGSSWSMVDSVTLGPTDDELEKRSVSVSGFIGENFGVRFLVNGVLGAAVLIDNVEVAGDLLPPPTTTTTTTTTTSSTTSSTSTTTTTLIKLPPPTLPELNPTTTTTINLPAPTLPELGPTTTTTTTTATTGTTTRPTSTTTDGSETTTPESSDTTTPLAADGDSGDGGPGDSGGSSDGGASPSGSDRPSSGLRQTAIGLVSDFETGLFGSTPEVLAFDITPGFASAVELIEASWYWVLGLALLIAAALIKGIGRLGVIDRSR